MFDFSAEGLIRAAFRVILLLLSLSVHEFAHAWTAWRLGDDTAARMGRLTLNPLSHADPVGTFLLPFLGIPFGWARPVPIDPTRFDRNVPMGRGMALTASAGPISNIVLALLAAIVLGLGLRFGYDAFGPGTVIRTLLYGDYLGGRFLPGLIPINVGLAVFNLLPIPPLDGSRIAAWLMPLRLRDRWHAFERMAPMLLLFVFFFAGRVVTGPILEVTSWLVALVNLIA